MEIIKNTECYGNTNSDKKFFKENCDKITPIKKITAYFDCENFIFTDYEVDNGTTFVAEGWNGNQIHLTGLNCGYGGTAPSGTAHILEKLGIESDLAHNLKHYPGIDILFDEKGNYQDVKVNKNVFLVINQNIQKIAIYI